MIKHNYNKSTENNVIVIFQKMTVLHPKIIKFTPPFLIFYNNLTTIINQYIFLLYIIHHCRQENDIIIINIIFLMTIIYNSY